MVCSETIGKERCYAVNSSPQLLQLSCQYLICLIHSSNVFLFYFILICLMCDERVLEKASVLISTAELSGYITAGGGQREQWRLNNSCL